MLQPSSSLCQSALGLQECLGNCKTEFDLCMDGHAECKDKGYTSKKCRKVCKKPNRACKDACDAATKCPLPPSCEDNDIDGLGTPWCELQVVSATFCDSAVGANKCRKTCDLCD